MDLAGMAPLEAEKLAVASLPAPVASSLRWRETSLFDEAGQFSGVRVMVDLHGRLSPSDIIAARAALQAWCLPLASDVLVKHLAELRLLVRRRNEAGEDIDAQTMVYARRLAEYPADVVTHVLTKWGDREEWWPSWAELKAQCDRYAGKRRAIMRALENAAAGVEAGR